MKRCSTCKKSLPESMFYKCRSRKDGLHVQCEDCMREARYRFKSLDSARVRDKRGNAKSLYDFLPAPEYRADESYNKVFNALAWWIRERTITKAQAEAIYLHAVECWSYAEIAEFCRCTAPSVRICYERGIANLRRRYADMAA